MDPLKAKEELSRLEWLRHRLEGFTCNTVEDTRFKVANLTAIDGEISRAKAYGCRVYDWPPKP